MRRTFFLIVCFAVFSFSAASSAEDKDGDDLRAKVQNPVSSIYSLPLKLTVDFGAPDGSAYFFNANPVISVTVGDWKLNSRPSSPPGSVWTGSSRVRLTSSRADRRQTEKTGWETSTIRCFFRLINPSRSFGAWDRPSILRVLFRTRKHGQGRNDSRSACRYRGGINRGFLATRFNRYRGFQRKRWQWRHLRTFRAAHAQGHDSRH
jgi:hypothetical protein